MNSGDENESRAGDEIELDSNQETKIQPSIFLQGWQK
jgi:hypothetical protein